MVAFDTSTVLFAIDPKTKPPIDPATGAPLEGCPERVEYLLKRLGDARTGILIPTPVLSEFLLRAGPNKHEFLERFLQSRNFVVGAFDQRAAIELALLTDADLAKGKALTDKQTKAKLRFDRQIIAIGKVQGAECIYTADGNLAATARANGLKAIMIWELPLPPEDPQLTLEGSW
jgi:predicted nucleic acid-binding protein